MYDPSLTRSHSTFISAKLKGLTHTNCTFGVERATMDEVPLIRVRPL